MKIKVSDYIAQFMTEHGVSHVFTITGGGAMHLNDAFGHKQGLKCIYNHHEQACAIAAEGYARLTGKVALVCVTSGPGGTNAITGVVGGWQDSIPMFVVSGQVKRETTTWSTDVPLRQLGDQEFQIAEVAKHMTKYAVMITEATDIRYHLEKAWYLCNNGRKGPVWLDVPLDIQAATVDTDDLRGYDPDADGISEKPVYDRTFTQKILEKIKEAKRPVILAGTAVRLADAYDIFHEVVDRLGVPVVTAWNAHDLMADDDPLYVGRPGTVGTRGGNFVVQNADLLIVIGCRMNIRMISYNYKCFAKNAYKIVVDIDEAELRKPTVSVDMPVCADLKDVLEDMAKALDDASNGDPNSISGGASNGIAGVATCYVNRDAFSSWLQWCRDIDARYPAFPVASDVADRPLDPYFFLSEFSRSWDKDECVVCGNGSACVITFQTAHIRNGQRLFTNSGCAAMGYGFPASLGCAVAREGKRVICIDGDGSFQMNIQELQTVVYNKLNIKIVIINNNGYHSIRQTQTNLFDPPMVGVNADNGISFPDLKKIAYAYDLPYVKIEAVSDMADGIAQIYETDGPVLCEVIVDEHHNFEPKLSSRRLEDGTMVSPQIDDMYPFLDREEYENNHFLKENSQSDQ